MNNEAVEVADKPEEDFGKAVSDFVMDLGDVEVMPWVELFAGLAIIFLIALVVHLVTTRFVLRAVGAVVKRSSTWWDDVLEEEHVFRRLAAVVPALVIHWGIPFVPGLPEDVQELMHRIVLATIAVIVARGLSSVLNGINAIYSRYEIARGRPIKGYVQVAQIVIYIVAVIFMIAALMNESPWYFVTGLGAMTAVLLLIFRDTLLSLVAGIQLTNNDLIRVGDWIDMPNFGANGTVVDIALNVVKVQNWDRTITVVPTHKFLDHSFKNWRSMFEGGGRRVQRAIHVDMSTVRFLTEEEIERYRKFAVLREYIDQKMQELEEYNEKNVPDYGADVMVNRRWLTNIGTLRAYIDGYLRRSPYVHDELPFMVRQLEPTSHGLPIEIYLFINDTRWAHFEAIQGDIFDHILAAVPEFGLKVFQNPSGSDIQGLR